ncbi:MAG: transglycosylase SLT domain-containing protein [Candidatus Gracilibacteria bacterium]
MSINDTPEQAGATPTEGALAQNESAPGAGVEPAKEQNNRVSDAAQEKTDISGGAEGALADQKADAQLKAVPDSGAPASTETPTAEEEGFMDEINKYYASIRGVGFFSAVFGTAWFAIQKLWSKLPWGDKAEGKKEEAEKEVAEKEVAEKGVVEKGEAKEEAKKEPVQLADYKGKEPVSPGEKKKAKRILEILKKHPDWATALKRASEKYELGPRGPSILMAIIEQENGKFDPGAPNEEGSGALGLGQFMSETWDGFLADPQNSEFAGKKRTDPIASIFATAWLASKNAKGLNVSLNDKDAPFKLYVGHHNGEDAAKTMFNYMEKGGPAGKVVGTYKSVRGYNYVQYTRCVTGIASAVQSNSEIYAYALSNPQYLG